MERDDDDTEASPGRLEATQGIAIGRRDSPGRSASEPTARDRPSARSGGAPSRAVSVFDEVKPRFIERDELGRGGMGRVVEAEDRCLERTVAIKHMLALDSPTLARFEREVRITARLQHPSIVPILDAGRGDDGLPYYVMRKIEGEPLSERVRAAGTVASRVALIPALLGAVDAAAYAHAQGYVHRDIKPWNILLGAFGETLLIDWGLARHIGASADPLTPSPSREHPDTALTQEGQAYGTPGYMAPEQARGEPADPRSDVYSLGATLYFVLTGASPFRDSSATIAVLRAAEGEMPDLESLRDTIPVELGAIVIKALDPARERRYADAGELATDLRRYIAGQLVAAHRYTTSQLVRRWVRRHLFATLVTATALLVVAVVGIIAIRSVLSERDEATAARRLAEDRNEEMLLDRARTSLATDPTSAVALLRSLPATSSRLPAAREITRAAVSLGVEHAITVGSSPLAALAFSPAGALASVSQDGTVRVHDVTTGTSRVLVTGRRADRLVWLDADHLAWSVSAAIPRIEVGVVDVRDGSTHDLPLDGISRLDVAFGRLFLLQPDGVVMALDGNGAHEVLARDVMALAANAQAVVMLRADALVVSTARDPQRVLPLARPAAASRIAISQSGARVAAATVTGVREWDAVAGAELSETIVASDDVAFIGYAGERLFVTRTDGRVFAADDRQGTRGSQWLAHGTPVSFESHPLGAVITTKTGEIGLVTPWGVVAAPHRLVELSGAAVSPDGHWLALASSSGAIPLVDLSHVLPRVIALEPRESLGAVDEDNLLVFSDGGAVSRIDHATAQRFPLTTAGFGASGSLIAGYAVVWTGEPRPRLVIGRGNDAPPTEAPDIRLWSVGASTAGAGSSAFAVGADGGVDEYPLAPGAGPRSLARIDLAGPGASSPRAIGRVEAADGVLYAMGISAPPTPAPLRIVDATGVHDISNTVTGQISSFRRDPDGVLWFVADLTTVYRAAPGQPAQRVDLDEPVRHLRIDRDEVWATSGTTIYRIDRRTGRVVNRRAVSWSSTSRARSSVKAWASVPSGYAQISATGLSIQMPRAGVVRELLLAREPTYLAASVDGRAIAAYIPGVADERGSVAVWVDPVPLDPAALPSYLATLTNARLQLGSDTITWDR